MIKQTCRNLMSRFSLGTKEAGAQKQLLLISLIERNCDGRLLKMKVKRWSEFVRALGKTKEVE